MNTNTPKIIIILSIILAFTIWGVSLTLRERTAYIPEPEVVVQEEPSVEDVPVEESTETEYESVYNPPKQQVKQVQVQPAVQAQVSADVYLTQIRQEYSRLLSVRQQLVRMRNESEDYSSITGDTAFDPNQMAMIDDARSDNFDASISYIDAKLQQLEQLSAQYQLGPNEYQQYQDDARAFQTQQLLEEINNNLNDLEDYLRYGY